MIYLVSNKIDCSTMDGITKLSIGDSLSMIRSWPVVQFDTETTGLDPHICNLTSLQFGYHDYTTGTSNQIVVDCGSVSPEEYRDVIERSYLIGQNLKFDLEFLFNHNIVPLNIYDTMICEQVLYLGHKAKRVGFALKDLYYRYTGETMDKSFQKKIASRGLTYQGILYAAKDVEPLQEIRKKQIMLAQSRNCVNAFILENRFVPAIAYLEWCGIHLDEDKWKAKMAKDLSRFNDTLSKLNGYVLSNPKLNTKFAASVTQLELFSDLSAAGPVCSVDWGSPKQVVPVCQALGFDTKVLDKEKHIMKDSIEFDVLSVQKGIDDTFLQIYGDYKEAEKKISTYGQNFLNLVNPNTNRLHTEFRQIGTVTGRMASGGGSEDDPNAKGKQNKDLARAKGLDPSEVKYVNMQNLPSRGMEGKITRACFTPMEGNVFISCDYSAEESRVQGDVWNEEKLLDSFRNGIDTHNVYAKLCFPEELKDVDVRDVKKKRPDLRDKAKSAEFAIGYGSDGSAIAKKLGMPKDEVKAMVSGILTGMKGMASFKKRTIKFLKQHGYIVIHPLTGHRVYWPEWSDWKAEEDRMDYTFWNNYNAYHRGTGDEVTRFVKRHNEKSHDWFDKNVLNYPIQGGSALVLKEAAANFFKWIVQKGYFGKVLFCVFVHDEIDVECPIEMTNEISEKLKETMQNASAKFYHKVEIPAECSIGDHWIH